MPVSKFNLCLNRYISFSPFMLSRPKGLRVLSRAKTYVESKYASLAQICLDTFPEFDLKVGYYDLLPFFTVLTMSLQYTHVSTNSYSHIFNVSN